VISYTIAAAEEVHDPLDGLVEKTARDSGAPFAPEVVAALAALKKDDRAAFEALRARLKSAGCRVTALSRRRAEMLAGVERHRQIFWLISRRLPNCSMRPTAPALLISTSIVIAKLGLSTAKGVGAA
jgi:hypothetical protein